MYEVEIVKSAIKELAKMPAKEAIRVTEKIFELRVDFGIQEGYVL